MTKDFYYYKFKKNVFFSVTVRSPSTSSISRGTSSNYIPSLPLTSSMKKQMSILDDSSLKDYQPEFRNSNDSKTDSFSQKRNQNLQSPATIPGRSDQTEFLPKSRISGDYKNQYSYLSQKAPEPVSEDQNDPDQGLPSLRRSRNFEDLRNASFSVKNGRTSSLSSTSSGSTIRLEEPKYNFTDQEQPKDGSRYRKVDFGAKFS